MMRDVDEYSFLASEEDGAMRMRASRAKGVKFADDVPPDKPMRAASSADDEKRGGCDVGPRPRLVIHLHGTAEVEDAGRDRGKFGRGQTEAIE